MGRACQSGASKKGHWRSSARREMSQEQLEAALASGGRLIVFEYCISLVLITFKRSSSVYFVPAGRGTLGRSLPFILLTLLLGWWGIPWGPIYTIGALITNFSGGRDVTAEILAAVDV
jgi:hypothetical protein